jgi:hypothetical protein
MWAGGWHPGKTAGVISGGGPRHEAGAMLPLATTAAAERLAEVSGLGCGIYRVPPILRKMGRRTGFHFRRKRFMVPRDFATGKVILSITIKGLAEYRGLWRSV